jgi:carotenoid cleavage dioxygenase
MKAWPNNPFLQGYYEPLTAECTAPDLIIEGEMPKDLNGTFYRNGPNPQFAPENEYHFFTGDGMIHAFKFDHGKVSHLNRWAQTARFKIEKELGGSFFSGMNPLETNPKLMDFVFTDKEGVANTSVIYHGGRLLLLEEGHLPFEMDPETLESHGAWNYYGKLNTVMTAHPKVDPVTGELVAFCYMATGPFSDDMGYYKVDKDGFLTEYHTFKIPYSSMVHDFVVTENYVVFPVLPIAGSLDRAMVGGPPFAWEPERGAHLGVMPRNGTPEEIQWIEMDPCYVFHFANGFEKDGKIIIDACHFESPPLFPMADGTPTPANIHPRMNRWEITMEGDKPVSITTGYTIDESVSGEFPVIDQRYAMREYSHTWFTSTDKTLAAKIPDSDYVYNRIVHFNVQTQEVDSYAFVDGYVSEPMFVPTEGGSEGEGYLISCVYNEGTNMSDLCVFDALNVKVGPVAKAKVSHRVPVCFHGTWKPAETYQPAGL